MRNITLSVLTMKEVLELCKRWLAKITKLFDLKENDCMLQCYNKIELFKNGS